MRNKIILSLITLLIPSFSFADDLEDLVDAINEVSTNNTEINHSTKALQDVCSTIVNIKSEGKCAVYKTKISGHIGNSNPRAKGNTWIGFRGCTKRYGNKMNFVDSKGNVVNSLVRYNNSGKTYAYRFYCTQGVQSCSGCCRRARSIYNTAVQNTGSGTIYAVGKNKRCVEIPDARKCYNSSGC
ncbi:hypothetical protein JNK13_05575 [bacterium]|nr:hypothetical protein [bacterium]